MIDGLEFPPEIRKGDESVLTLALSEVITWQALFDNGEVDSSGAPQH